MSYVTTILNPSNGLMTRAGKVLAAGKYLGQQFETSFTVIPVERAHDLADLVVCHLCGGVWRRNFAEPSFVWEWDVKRGGEQHDCPPGDHSYWRAWRADR